MAVGGLIGMVDIKCTPSEYPNGMEWAAIVLPGGLECMDIRPQYIDRARTRRIAYGQLLSLKRLSEMVAVRDISRKQAHGRLVAATTWAQFQPDVGWFEPDKLVH